MINLLKSLKGYVNIRAEGFFVEKFLNLCSESNIYIWDVKNISENVYTLSMSIKAFRVAKKFARDTRTQIKITQKMGFPFFVYRLKFRKGITIGFVTGIVMFLFLTSFVWSIEIEGNVAVSDEEILTALKDSGFRKGVSRYFLDESDLQNSVLLKIKKLSWMWVYLEGTKARVEVRERVDTPEIVDKTTPSNIIASSDGLITDIVVKDGEPAVKVGDVVKKGDLLIGGVVGIGEDKFRLTNARGEVFARTWKKQSAVQPLNVKKYKKTGKKITKKVVKLPWFDVLLYMDNTVPFAYYDETGYQNTPTFFGLFDLPFTYRSTTYEEKVEYTERLTCDMAYEIKKEELERDIKNNLSDSSKIVNITADRREEVDGVYVTVVCECIEQIGQKVFIDGG